jgi:hypothetical protein
MVKMAKSSRLPDDKVIDKVCWLWENGFTKPTSHFNKELQKAGATTQDVNSLIKGIFRVESAKWEKTHRNWNYKLIGYDKDGDEISIVVSLDIKNSILRLITAF